MFLAILPYPATLQVYRILRHSLKVSNKELELHLELQARDPHVRPRIHGAGLATDDLIAAKEEFPQTEMLFKLGHAVRVSSTLPPEHPLNAAPLFMPYGSTMGNLVRRIQAEFFRDAPDIVGDIIVCSTYPFIDVYDENSQQLLASTRMGRREIEVRLLFAPKETTVRVIGAVHGRVLYAQKWSRMTRWGLVYEAIESFRLIEQVSPSQIGEDMPLALMFANRLRMPHTTIDFVGSGRRDRNCGCIFQ